MTRGQLIKRVEFWRGRLCPDWRVAVMDTPHPGDGGATIAHVQSTLMIEEIRVYFRPDLLDDDLVRVDRVIVHELLHPLLDRVLHHEDTLAPFIPPAMWDAHVDGRRGDMEQFVNRMAHVITAMEHGGWPIYGTRECSGTTAEG